MINNKTLYIAILAISATMFGALMASSVKYLSDDLHPITICFYRCIMGLILITPFMIKNNFEATRYHSLVVDRKTFPKDLVITAETQNRTVMGLMHKNYNIHGFQFHPESISTKVGMKLIKNFIAS